MRYAPVAGEDTGRGISSGVPGRILQTATTGGDPELVEELASHKWNWDYFKSKVGIYNNVKSDAYTPVNTADDSTTFAEYIDTIRKGPAVWRIFLFNIFSHAPELTRDFTWPDHLIKGFVKSVPILLWGTGVHNP